jgi:hypothetical protein
LFNLQQNEALHPQKRLKAPHLPISARDLEVTAKTPDRISKRQILETLTTFAARTIYT